MSSRLAYWSGFASIIGGFLFAVAVVLHPLRDGISVQQSGSFYQAIHLVGVYGLIFQLFALLGLYLPHMDVMGQRGLVSFIVVFFGQVFFTCVQVGDAILNPLLAKYAPQLVHAAEEADPTLMLVALPGLVLFLLGYILFGTALRRAKVQSSLGSLLITIGAPVYIIGGFSLAVFGSTSPVVTLIESAGAVPLGLGFILMGLKNLSDVNIKIDRTLAVGDNL